jgi:hypothetical protein
VSCDAPQTLEWLHGRHAIAARLPVRPPRSSPSSIAAT